MMAGRYELHEVLGTGAFATVHRATDPRLDASVAVKILADNWSRDPDVRSRFRSEAVFLRRVQSEAAVPGIVAVFDIDETADGRPYLVMSYADLGTLRERAAHRPWPVSDVLPVVEAVADTVGALHRAGVVHRDLKPSNLLLRTDRGAVGGTDLLKDGERLLVGDLGMAKDALLDTTALSFAGGTARYMAPEQHTIGVAVDHRADVHAASVIVAELLAGSAQLPPTGSPLEGQLPDSLTPEVRAVLDRGVAVDAQRRQQSMDEWCLEIKSAFEADADGVVLPNADSAASADGPAKSNQSARPRRRLILGISTLLAIAVAVALAVFLSGQEPGLEIVGPDQVVVGEPATYRVDDGRGAVWTDWTGAQVTAPEFEVSAILPGQLSFSAARDSERGERSIQVIPSGLGPTINGPADIRLGQQAVFTVTLPGDSVASYWVDPDGARTETADLRFRPSSIGTEVISVVSIDSKGVERGARLVVEVDG